MRVLVACEFSGVVRDAFRRAGHDAWSCDLLPCEAAAANHIEGDVLPVAYSGEWDLMIAHPPCTDLAVSGARWFAAKGAERQEKALAFVRALMDAPIPHICIENPVSVISSRIRPADQTIQPWMFGHGEVKATCLWLTNLPKLIPTHRKGDLFAPEPPTERVARVHLEPPGPERWKNRARTFPGIAEAMAAQWGAAASHESAVGRPVGVGRAPAF